MATSPEKCRNILPSCTRNFFIVLYISLLWHQLLHLGLPYGYTESENRHQCPVAIVAAELPLVPFVLENIGPHFSKNASVGRFQGEEYFDLQTF